MATPASSERRTGYVAAARSVRVERKARQITVVAQTGDLDLPGS
jgi:hypothetical protein